MNDPEFQILLLIFLLIGLGVLAATLSRHTRALNRIESRLEDMQGTSSDIERRSEIEPEVEALIAANKMNRAVVLYRALHDVSYKEAEMVILRRRMVIKRNRQTAEPDK